MPELNRGGPRLLEVTDLNISLPVEDGRREIVRNVSFGLDTGQAMALVGESGAGKSLTAKAVARLLPVGAEVSGQIRFAGDEVNSLAGDSLRAYRTTGVGLVSQDPRSAINPVRRIGDFLTEALITNLHVSPAEAQERVTVLLDEAGVSNPRHRLRQYPHELSTGLLQRVMIASVIAAQPRLILADEPTSALDVTTQSEVMAILAEMRERHGMALLLITHDLDLAAAVCERTSVMYAGRLVEQQPSPSLHTDPLHPYTAALVTSRPALEARADRLPVISGRPQAAFEVLDACPFAPRCGHVQQRCRDQEPPLLGIGGGESACLRAEELRGRVWPPGTSVEQIADAQHTH